VPRCWNDNIDISNRTVKQVCDDHSDDFYLTPVDAGGDAIGSTGGTDGQRTFEVLLAPARPPPSPAPGPFPHAPRDFALSALPVSPGRRTASCPRPRPSSLRSCGIIDHS
jgi:hypothetical protein